MPNSFYSYPSLPRSLNPRALPQREAPTLSGGFREPSGQYDEVRLEEIKTSEDCVSSKKTCLTIIVDFLKVIEYARV